MSLDKWQEMSAEASGVTTEELDAAIQGFKDQEAVYNKAKDLKTLEYNRLEEEKKKVLELFEKSGKTKYFVEGLGTAYQIRKYQVVTPKLIEEKKAFFEFLKTKYGENYLMDKLGVNSSSLNKIYNDSLAEAKENGDDISLFKIPGIQEPQARVSLGFRKESK